MIITKFSHVSVHEMAHFAVYLYVGGPIDKIRTIQLKPKSGWFESYSFSVAENYLANSCLSLGGPVSDILISMKEPNKNDIIKAKEIIRLGLLRFGLDDSESAVQLEYEAAWKLTEFIINEQKELICRLAEQGIKLMNANNLISCNKAQKLGKEVLDEWSKNETNYYLHPNLVKI
jgi:hypothetical protein